MSVGSGSLARSQGVSVLILCWVDMALLCKVAYGTAGCPSLRKYYIREWLCAVRYSNKRYRDVSVLGRFGLFRQTESVYSCLPFLIVAT